MSEHEPSHSRLCGQLYRRVIVKWKNVSYLLICGSWNFFLGNLTAVLALERCMQDGAADKELEAGGEGVTSDQRTPNPNITRFSTNEIHLNIALRNIETPVLQHRQQLVASRRAASRRGITTSTSPHQTQLPEIRLEERERLRQKGEKRIWKTPPV